MTIPELPPYVFPSKPVPQITPFTYRDGVTMLKKLDGIVRYINRELVPFVNENYSELADAFETQVNILIAQVNAAIEAVINDSVEVQDPVVAALIANLDSDTSNALDLRYALKSVVDSIQTTIDSGRLSDTALDSAYAAKADVETLTELVTTGRLSDTELDASYAAKSVETTVETGRLSDANLEAKFQQVFTLPRIPAYQISPSAFNKWDKALARSINGGAIAKVLFVGDSTTQGSETVALSFPTALIAALNRRGTKARTGIVNAGPTNIPDDRWGVTAGWAIAGNLGPAGGTFRSAADNANKLYCSPKITFTNFALYYAIQAGGGTSTLVDGATTIATINSAVGSVNTYGSNSFARAGTPASVFGLTGPTGGPINILGFEAWDTANPALIAVTNMGQSGVATNAWVSTAMSLEAISFASPDITFIMLGINDALAAQTPENYVANIGTLVTRARLSGDVVIIGFPETDPAFNPGATALEDQYEQQIMAYAKAANVPYIDINARYGGYSGSSGWYRDQVHQSNAANKDIGEILSGILVN